MDLRDKMQLLIDYDKNIESIYNADMDAISWETKYELVFAHMKPHIDKLGFELDWVNTDTSYQDDLYHYWDALNKKAEEFRAILKEIDRVH
jgi:hypothetical protein